MLRINFIALFLLTSITFGHSLECYYCSNCADPFDSTLAKKIDCPDNMACGKIIYDDGLIYRNCVPEKRCLMLTQNDVNKGMWKCYPCILAFCNSCIRNTLPFASIIIASLTLLNIFVSCYKFN